MNKNQAGKWIVFAYGLPTHATLAGKAITGDAANITANIRLDGGAANAVDDTNPTELEDGYYVFDITAAESNGDLLSLHPASSTAHVQVIGVPGAVWTRPPNFEKLGIASDGDISGNIDGAVASVTGAVGSVTGNVGGNVVGSVASVTGNVGGNVVGSVASVTGAVNSVTSAVTLPTIPASWITASGIAAGALDGKGNWNIGKTGYTLSQAFPTNFSSLSITGGGAVTAGTVSDKTGYSLSQAFPSNFADLVISAGTGRVTVGTNADKSGYSISGTLQTLDALENVSAAEVGTEVAGALISYDGATAADLSAAIGSLNNISPAQVNAEVVDALATDTYAEPGQGSPGATISIAQKINYLYKAWRNQSRQTATEYRLMNDAGTVVDHKAAVSDDGTTAIKGKTVTGP